jgi:hypothetical protein
VVLQELVGLAEWRARVVAAASHQAGALQKPVARVEWWAAVAVVAPRVAAVRPEQAEPAPPADATRT